MNKNVQIQIPSPCTQNWDDMETVPGGKFCSSCEKKVIDFTLLNDRQIIEILRKKNKGCGRFTDEQLNRELIVTDAQSNSFIPAIIVSTALATGITTSAYAARERLPAVQDTSVTSADTIPAKNDCEMVAGYTALKNDLVVTGYRVTTRRITVGGYIGIKTTDSFKKDGNSARPKRISFFSKILIALRLSKRPL